MFSTTKADDCISVRLRMSQFPLSKQIGPDNVARQEMIGMFYQPNSRQQQFDSKRH